MMKLVTFTFYIVNAYRNIPVLAYGNQFSKTIVLYPIIENYSTVALATGLVCICTILMVFHYRMDIYKVWQSFPDMCSRKLLPVFLNTRRLGTLN